MSTTSKTTRHKIKNLNELAIILSGLKNDGSKVVHCHGVFDLLHIGHIRHFEQAKEMGDILVVTLTEDQHVNKGPGRPAFGQDLRAEAIAALDSVDFVAINQWPQATEAIKLLQPDFYVKGSDYRDASQDNTGGIVQEEAAVVSRGGQLVFTDDITFSSTHLLNHHTEILSKEIQGYLEEFTSRYSFSDILGYLDNAQSLKVLLLGETIIDEYQYCEILGKSAKEPILATRHLSTEIFAGGVIAVSNHVSAFSGRVSVLSFLGETNSKEDFVRECLDPSIDGMFMYMGGGTPTITKRRFVDTYQFRKLFEIYEMEPEDLRPKETFQLTSTLEEILPDYDVVIVTDYGHGMMTPPVVEVLNAKARFLAVNTQINAGNHGFNTVSKYPRADFVCISEPEIRLDARSRSRDLRDLIVEISEKLSCDRVIITGGERGCLCYDKDTGFQQVPALATNVVDRIGAGDAVLAISALCVAQGAPMELVGVVGNAAGAEAVATVGHRRSIQRVPFIRHLESLLK
jgi:rfaE bifunctional protein kinase chain/domain/rfaE bifunctional protein nucleotidyltransferase chain/domain